MGTLVENIESPKKSKKILDLDLEEKVVSKNSKKLHKEYNKFRRHIEELRRAYSAVDNAVETDDIYFRLQKLENASKKLRRKYAKSHRKILKATR